MTEDKNPMAGIAGVIGGTTIAMIALVLIFSPVNAWVIAPIVASMAVLGIFLGYFASKKK